MPSFSASPKRIREPRVTRITKAERAMRLALGVAQVKTSGCYRMRESGKANSLQPPPPDAYERPGEHQPRGVEAELEQQQGA